MNFQIVLDALVKIFTDIVNFIPNLVNGLIILLVGYLVARLVSSLIGFILRQIKFDPLSTSILLDHGDAVYGLGRRRPAVESTAGSASQSHCRGHCRGGARTLCYYFKRRDHAAPARPAACPSPGRPTTGNVHAPVR